MLSISIFQFSMKKINIYLHMSIFLRTFAADLGNERVTNNYNKQSFLSLINTILLWINKKWTCSF